MWRGVWVCCVVRMRVTTRTMYSDRCVAILRFARFTPRTAAGTSWRNCAPTVSKRLIVSWVAFVSSTESRTPKRACCCRPISFERSSIRRSIRHERCEDLRIGGAFRVDKEHRAVVREPKRRARARILGDGEQCRNARHTRFPANYFGITAMAREHEPHPAGYFVIANHDGIRNAGFEQWPRETGDLAAGKACHQGIQCAGHRDPLARRETSKNAWSRIAFIIGGISGQRPSVCGRIERNLADRVVVTPRNTQDTGAELAQCGFAAVANAGV